MRHSISILAFMLVCLASSMLMGKTGDSTENVFEASIRTYLKDAQFKTNDNAATVFADLLIKKDGDIFKVDFVVTPGDELVILSADYATEYYRMNEIDTTRLKMYSVPMTEILV